MKMLSLFIVLVFATLAAASPAFAMCCGKKTEMKASMKCKPGAKTLKSNRLGPDIQSQSQPANTQRGSGAGGKAKIEGQAKESGGCCCCKQS